MPNADTATILEVGCGAGFSVDYLDGHFARYIGVDYAEELIGYAKAHHEGPNVEFHACDIREFECQPPCDVVVMIGVLHHFDDIPGILQHIVKLVRPGGWIVANEPQSANPIVELARRIRKSVDAAYSDDQVTLDGDRLRSLYENAGLDNIRIVPQGFTSTPFAEVVLPPQVVTRVLSKAACGFDTMIGQAPAKGMLQNLSWNLIAAGQRG